MRGHFHRGRRFSRDRGPRGFKQTFREKGPGGFGGFQRIFRQRSFSGLYRSRSGMILGVCKGLANYFDLSLVWVRVIAVVLLVFTGFWPVGIIYLVAALIMKPEPVITPADDTEEEFYSSYASSRTMALNRLKNTYQSLERRLQRLEHTVTSREFNWQRKV